MNQFFKSNRLSLAAVAYIFGGIQILNAQIPSVSNILDLDAVVNEFGVDGSGILIAIIDEGIDYRLPDFRNEDGTTRIEYIYDLHATPAKTYAKQDINDALENENLLNVIDGYGSSTALAGIMAGNGETPYAGLAPKASLIVVKAAKLGVPGDDSQANDNPTLIDLAIEFVIRKSWEIGKPTVVFVNSRKLGGPTDGSSRASRLIEAYSGPSKPNLIFVTPSGPLTASDFTAAGSIQAGATKTITVEKRQESSLLVDFWYTTYDSNDNPLPPLSVSITSPNDTKFGPFMPTQSEGFAEDDYNPPEGISIFHRSSGLDFSRSNSDMRQLMFQLRGDPGQYTIELSLEGAATEAVDFRGTLSSNTRTGSNPSRFLDNIGAPSVSDIASSPNAIVVNGYALGSSWTDSLGNPQSDDSAKGDPGHLLTGLDETTTNGGDTVVDISAPAGSLLAPYSTDSYLADVSSNLIEDGDPAYGVIQENHGAGAIVAGLIALMLQIDPTLTAEEAESLIANSAILDESVGNSPSSAWGAGKLSAGAALEGAALLSHDDATLSTQSFASSATPKTLEFGTMSGFQYTLQYRSALEAGEWEDTSQTLEGNGETQSFTLANEGPNSITPGFYRIRVSRN